MPIQCHYSQFSYPSLNIQQMSQYKNQFEIESELSSENQFHQFQKEVKIPEQKMYELVYHQEQYDRVISDLIRQGINKIKVDELKYGLAYLSEAEKLLEYGASCGKIIDRQLIISTLHNQALCYQRMNEHDRALKYVEAIIFNLKAHFKTLQNTPTLSRITEHHKKRQLSEQVVHLYSNKIQLAQYYLVFCSLNSQLGKREQSLDSGRKAIKIYKEYFQELIKNVKLQQTGCLGEDRQKLLGVLKNLKIYRNEDEFQKEDSAKFIKIGRNCTKKWIQQNKKKSSETPLDKMMANYSIANLVELNVRQISKKSKQKEWQVFTQGKKILKNLANFSMAYFQVATQYRLILDKKYSSSTAKHSSIQFKYSLIFYLLAIIFIALYIPYNFLFMKQLLQSFEYHFKIQLTKGQQATQASPDILFLLPSMNTIIKSQKKSKNIRSISKTTQNKINKLKSGTKKKQKQKNTESKAQDQYLVVSKKITQSRNRINSDNSKKSFGLQPRSLEKNCEKEPDQLVKARMNRIRSVTKLNRDPIPEPNQQNDDFSDYGTKIDLQRAEIDQTKKVTKRASRTTSVDQYSKQIKGLQEKTLPKKQQQQLIQYPSLYKGFKKSSSSNKILFSKATDEKKTKKKIENNSKDSKFSISRASAESTKKKKKSNMNKKQKAKQQTLANYYL